LLLHNGKCIYVLKLKFKNICSSFKEAEGRLEGLEVISPNEYEIILTLNQMGVFNFVEELQPGYASLKLIEGRKKTMSLWLEFITASGLED